MVCAGPRMTVMLAQLRSVKEIFYFAQKAVLYPSAVLVETDQDARRLRPVRVCCGVRCLVTLLGRRASPHCIAYFVCAILTTTAVW
jgi:hypothetical protein